MKEKLNKEIKNYKKIKDFNQLETSIKTSETLIYNLFCEFEKILY